MTEMSEAQIALAEKVAKALGYEQTAYTSTSALWGLFCLKENPATWRGDKQALRAGCLIQTKELGLLFVSDLDDLNLHDLADEERKAVQS